MHKLTSIRFRETTHASSRRDFVNIHPSELEDAIMRILEVTEIMHLDALFTMVVGLCGFQSVSARIKEYIIEVIGRLERSRKIKTIDDFQIKLVSD